MPARDTYHDQVVHALVADGWVITHDPLHLPYGGRDTFVDLGAERVLSAEKRGQKIAVEVKSFIGPSLVRDLEQALGQFALYADLLAEVEPDRVLYLAVSDKTHAALFDEPIGRLLVKNRRLKLIVFDGKTEVITQWIPEIATDK
jgi:hypothetical protein